MSVKVRLINEKEKLRKSNSKNIMVEKSFIKN